MTYGEPNPTLIREVIREIDDSWDGNRLLDCKICYALGMNWIDDRWIDTGIVSWRDHIEQKGFEAAWVSDHVYTRDCVPLLTTSVDAVYNIIWKYLPQHDGIDISRDPSGVGAEICNWFLSDPSENYRREIGKSSHVTEALALLSASLKALLLKIEGE